MRYEYDNSNTSSIKTQEYNYNNNNNPNGAGRVPRPPMSPEDLAAIREAYEDNIGRLTAAAAHLIEQTYEDGMFPQDIIWAIEETGLAPQPSAYYLRAVLTNWAREGVVYSRVHDKTEVCWARKGGKWWK